MHVQSLEQLEIAESSQLYLFFVRLREPVGNGLTLPSVVTELLIEGVSSSALHELLAEVGYSVADKQHYLDQRFELVEESIYLVDPKTFPRLTKRSFAQEIPRGIRRINYEIDLDAADVDPLPPGETDRVVKQMASG